MTRLAYLGWLAMGVAVVCGIACSVTGHHNASAAIGYGIALSFALLIAGGESK